MLPCSGCRSYLVLHLPPLTTGRFRGRSLCHVHWRRWPAVAATVPDATNPAATIATLAAAFAVTTAAATPAATAIAATAVSFPFVAPPSPSSQKPLATRG